MNGASSCGRGKRHEDEDSNGDNCTVDAVLASMGNERRFQEQAGMSKTVFMHLLTALEGSGAVKSSRWVSAGEKLLVALYILGGKSNRDSQERQQHSGETITRILHEFVAAVLGLQEQYITRRPAEVLSSKFLPYFEKCTGALDGTHIKFVPRGIDSRAFRNRKGEITQNVLAVRNFDLSFSYVLAGWEGSAHDGRVLRDAWTKGLECGEGQFYLGDAGYSLTKTVLTPYRGVRYHLKEWEKGNQRPQDKKELFNLRHSSLRNAVERAFGVAKRRFGILGSIPEYSIYQQSDIILCCFVLHNYILLHRNESEDDFVGRVVEYDFDEANSPQEELCEMREAVVFRDTLAEKCGWITSNTCAVARYLSEFTQRLENDFTDVFYLNIVVELSVHFCLVRMRCEVADELELAARRATSKTVVKVSDGDLCRRQLRRLANSSQFELAVGQQAKRVGDLVARRPLALRNGCVARWLVAARYFPWSWRW